MLKAHWRQHGPSCGPVALRVAGFFVQIAQLYIPGLVSSIANASGVTDMPSSKLGRGCGHGGRPSVTVVTGLFSSNEAPRCKVGAREVFEVQRDVGRTSFDVPLWALCHSQLRARSILRWFKVLRRGLRARQARPCSAGAEFKPGARVCATQAEGALAPASCRPAPFVVQLR
jgi:hypothetical protein